MELTKQTEYKSFTELISSLERTISKFRGAEARGQVSLAMFRSDIREITRCLWQEERCATQDVYAQEPLHTQNSSSLALIKISKDEGMQTLDGKSLDNKQVHIDIVSSRPPSSSDSPGIRKFTSSSTPSVCSPVSEVSEGTSISDDATAEFVSPSGHLWGVVKKRKFPDSENLDRIEPVKMNSIMKRQLVVSDDEQVWQYLLQSLLAVQQKTCKNLAKAWVRAIEPQKQSKYPYKNRGHSRPAWWPANARHIEPDHLVKEERVKLLLHLMDQFEPSFLRANSGGLLNSVDDHWGLVDEMLSVAEMQFRYRQGCIPTCEAVAYVTRLTISKRLQTFRKVISEDSSDKLTTRQTAEKTGFAYVHIPPSSPVEPPVCFANTYQARFSDSKQWPAQATGS